MTAFKKLYFLLLTVTGQAMPPPGSDSGSDDPASESSDTATSEPKTFLVMSGGEGYIDFRMGEDVMFPAVTVSALSAYLIQRIRCDLRGLLFI